jgi:hypothetical protein
MLHILPVKQVRTHRKPSTFRFSADEDSPTYRSLIVIRYYVKTMHGRLLRTEWVYADTELHRNPFPEFMQDFCERHPKASARRQKHLPGHLKQGSI